MERSPLSAVVDVLTPLIPEAFLKCISKVPFVSHLVPENLRTDGAIEDYVLKRRGLLDAILKGENILEAWKSRRFSAVSQQEDPERAELSAPRSLYHETLDVPKGIYSLRIHASTLNRVPPSIFMEFSPADLDCSDPSDLKHRWNGSLNPQHLFFLVTGLNMALNYLDQGVELEVSTCLGLEIPEDPESMRKFRDFLNDGLQVVRLFQMPALGDGPH